MTAASSNAAHGGVVCLSVQRKSYRVFENAIILILKRAFHTRENGTAYKRVRNNRLAPCGTTTLQNTTTFGRHEAVAEARPHAERSQRLFRRYFASIPARMTYLRTSPPWRLTEADNLYPRKTIQPRDARWVNNDRRLLPLGGLCARRPRFPFKAETDGAYSPITLRWARLYPQMHSNGLSLTARSFLS